MPHFLVAWLLLLQKILKEGNDLRYFVCYYIVSYQVRHARFPVACPMATGLVRCRRFPSMELPSWTKVHSRTQVTGVFYHKSRYQLSALQCRLECQPGYVANRKPLITCVNGEYAKGAIICQNTNNISLILKCIQLSLYGV